MKWKKIGLIFNADQHSDWMCSHASLPIAQNIKGDLYRIFFSTRDMKNRSSGAYIDININDPGKILHISEKPVIEPGPLGAFDDSGVSLSCIVDDKFYYLGWNLLKTVPFSNQIGLGMRVKNKIERYSVIPVLQKCEKEPFSFGYPWVIKHRNVYRMWYDAILRWNGITTDDYICSLRYAESKDGIHWNKTYLECVEMKAGERCIARPCVIVDDNMFHMFYSINSHGRYSIGYAESQDGISWLRKDDEAGLGVSASGWDSEEIEYPHVFDHEGERYMLYNGNGYGKSGFGLAKLER